MWQRLLPKFLFDFLTWVSKSHWSHGQLSQINNLPDARICSRLLCYSLPQSLKQYRGKKFSFTQGLIRTGKLKKRLKSPTLFQCFKINFLTKQKSFWRRRSLTIARPHIWRQSISIMTYTYLLTLFVLLTAMLATTKSSGAGGNIWSPNQRFIYKINVFFKIKIFNV